MLRTLLPERIFLPIFVNINLRTPFWSSIFFWLTKMIPPFFSSWIQSPFQIAWPLTMGNSFKGYLGTGEVINLFWRYPWSITTYTLASSLRMIYNWVSVILDDVDSAIFFVYTFIYSTSFYGIFWCSTTAIFISFSAAITVLFTSVTFEPKEISFDALYTFYPSYFDISGLDDCG